jgi:AraC-like DNA-binding protein
MLSKLANAMATTHRKHNAEFEHDLIRHPSLGYESSDTAEFVRCVEHARQTSLERWHYHDEYELQLIVGARGQALVGDYVGHFEPGHLVLTGPRLPHNWITTEVVSEIADDVRHLVVQFRGEPLTAAMQVIRELEEVRPLLERARRGVEFFGISEDVAARFQRIKHSRGLQRFAEFAALLSLLQRCEDVRLLSTDSASDPGDGTIGATIQKILRYVHDNHTGSLSLAEVATHVGLSKGAVSRYFSNTTDGNFTNFVNRVRINEACELLSRTDSPISNICYEVGFNNVANFNRRFREIKHSTPSEFRQKTKNV